MRMILALTPNWLEITVASILAAFLCLAAGYVAGAVKELQRLALAAAEATANAVQKRADRDEAIISMDSLARASSLGGVSNVTNCMGWKQISLQPDTALYLAGNAMKAGQCIASQSIG
ncbi:hypothetical protein [Ochrobactrum sp. EDr1-4]|uniref:hypothetical protein n=1 Tax=Ochrobactrum sp. EDr1-4 TaxID=3368622 RepID=UPI003BA04D15